ncbi:MAG: HNH endonuclease [Candidatus Poribacteria bacterium]|nr:HNH endonuclease [Candidatus Poribacteria bacterium]
MSVSYPTKIRLALRSGNRCALPDCGQSLSPDSESGNPIRVGVAAHIAGEHGGGTREQRSARYDPKMTEKERNDYNNLIYICPTCHEKIDAIPQGEMDYPVERLRKIKREHEQTVRDAIADAFVDVGFPELEEATQWITQVNPQQPDKDFSVIALEDKLNKNALRNGSRRIIIMGLSVSHEVRAFIESRAQMDQGFPERLKSGFLQEYYRLKQKGHTGDDLFVLMCQFAQQGFEDQVKKSAGLAVLVYLFETCEVFEK